LVFIKNSYVFRKLTPHTICNKNKTITNTVAVTKTSMCDHGKTSKINGENMRILIRRIYSKYSFKIIIFTSRPWLEKVFLFSISKATHSFLISRLSCLYYQMFVIKRPISISPKLWRVLGTIYVEKIMQTFFYKRILIMYRQIHDSLAKRMAIEEHPRPTYVHNMWRRRSQYILKEQTGVWCKNLCLMWEACDLYRD